MKRYNPVEILDGDTPNMRILARKKRRVYLKIPSTGGNALYLIKIHVIARRVSGAAISKLD